jgi:hypothetical protein
LDDFLVCLLHDSPKVRAILESGQLPHAYWWPDNRPIVVPCGELKEEHLVPAEASSWLSASEDPAMLEVPEGPTGMLRPEFDLSEGL